MYLSTEPLHLARLVEQVQAPSRGGIACFTGAVRDLQDGRAVARLEYSAYGAMAEAECERIVREAEARWPCAVALQHRIGTLAVGEAAVAVAAASAHREEAFAACRYVIEEVKRRVPIWKREVFADGRVEWVDPERGSGYAGKRVSAEVADPAREKTTGELTAHVEGQAG
jgi:molybdopterin synthase catalytic subunit